MKNIKKYMIRCLVVAIFILLGSCIMNHICMTQNEKVNTEVRKIPKRKYIKIPRKNYSQDVME